MDAFVSGRFRTIMKTPSLFLAAALSLSHASGQTQEKEPDVAASFPGLKSMAVDGQGEEFSPISQKVSYDSGLTKVINKVLNPGEEGAPEVKRLISTKLDRNAESVHFIDFDPGPSADPQFIIVDEKSGKKVGEIAADSLVMPGNGFIYAIARSNHLHLERRKYAVKNGGLKELEQPFAYVGLTSKAKVPLTLTAGKDGGETIANIPKDGALEVVIRDGDHLLIKTPVGLLGWWKMKTDVTADNAEIEGIYYAGD